MSRIGATVGAPSLAASALAILLLSSAFLLAAIPSTSDAQAGTWSGTLQVQISTELITGGGSGQWSFTVNTTDNLTGQSSWQTSLNLISTDPSCQFSPSSISMGDQETWTGTVQGTIATISATGSISAPSSLTLICTSDEGPITSSVPFSIPLSYAQSYSFDLAQLQSGSFTTSLGLGVTATYTLTSSPARTSTTHTSSQPSSTTLESSSSVSSTTATTQASTFSTATSRTTSISVPFPTYVLAAQDQLEDNFMTNMLNSYLIYSAQHPMLDCTNQMLTQFGKCEVNGATFTLGIGEDRVLAYAKEVVTDKVMDAAWKLVEVNVPGAGPIIMLKDAAGKVWDVYNKFYEVDTLISSPTQGASVDITLFTITASVPPPFPIGDITQELAQWTSTHKDSLQFVQVNLDPGPGGVTVSDTSDSTVDLSSGTVTGTVQQLRSVFAIAMPAENGTQAQDLVQLAKSTRGQSNITTLFGSSYGSLLILAAIIASLVALGLAFAVRRARRHPEETAVTAAETQVHSGPLPQASLAPPTHETHGPLCPNCNNPTSENDTFCDNCGVKLDFGRTCPHCNSRNLEDAVYCTNCGEAL